MIKAVVYQFVTLSKNRANLIEFDVAGAKYLGCMQSFFLFIHLVSQHYLIYSFFYKLLLDLFHRLEIP